MYGIKKDKQKKEISKFTTEINALSYEKSLALDELSNQFVIKSVEKQLNEGSDSIYLGNRICKKINQDKSKEGIYLLSRNKHSIFEVNLSEERINPQLTGKVLRVSVLRKQ